MFTLEQARSFIAVAEELHFGRAAERLNMTQPPLSRQIQKLEKEIGAELLDRNNRRVALTAAGQAFLAEARSIITSAHRAPVMARRIAAGRAGILRIGFTAASGYTLLGPLLTEIAEHMPEIDIDLRELVTGEQIQALVDGDLDLGLARPPFDADIFESQLLFSENLMLATPTNHPLNQLKRPVTAADLRDVPLIMHSPTQARYFYDLAVRHMAIEHKNVVHTVSQILTMIALVAANRGVAFVPESSMALGIDGVNYLRLAGVEGDIVEMHAIWNREIRNPAVTSLLKVVRERAAE